MAKLTYLGHGSFKIIDNNKTIYVDPYAGSYEDPADLILITHQHSDHNQINLVKQTENCKVITNKESLIDGVYQKIKMSNLEIEAVEAYNKNHKKEESVGYLLKVADKLLYFSGDTSTTFQMNDLKNQHIDYAFYCVDGIYNMDIQEASECANIVAAKHSIPVHTSPKKLFDKEIANKFTGINKLILNPNQEIEL